MAEYIETGSKVSLRLMTSEDTDLIVKWRNNPRVRDNFIYREKFDRATHENWIKTKVNTGEVVQMIICEQAEPSVPGQQHKQAEPSAPEQPLQKYQQERPVGSVYYRDIDKEKAEAEYGIFIGEDDAIGKGYGNETAELALKYAKEILKLKRVILRVFTDNTAAWKSYEHAGFRKIEELPAVECSDGTKSDMILMAVDL